MTKRRMLIGGILAAAALAGLAYYKFILNTKAETEIIVGDGSILLKSGTQKWSDYDYFPGGSPNPAAIVWTNKKEDGYLTKVTDGTKTVDCDKKDLCIIDTRYVNGAGQEARVVVLSGNKGSRSKGLTIISTLPLGGYTASGDYELKSTDTSFELKEANVWTSTSTQPEKFCTLGAQCKITLRATYSYK